jgi:hypothetical protein
MHRWTMDDWTLGDERVSGGWIMDEHSGTMMALKEWCIHTREEVAPCSAMFCSQPCDNTKMD